MKHTELQTFSNNEIGEIRGFIGKDGEPWFFAGQVCRCLKLKNSSSVLKGVRDRHNKFGDKIDGVGISYVTITDSIGRKQQAAVVSEKILYEIIFRAGSEKAYNFQQWVFEEVLPSIRKHGHYRMEGKLIRRTMTDAIKESGENERMKGHAYSTYSKLINRSLGLPPKVNRDGLDDVILEKIAKRENLVQAMIQNGAQYNAIKEYILANAEVSMIGGGE